MEDPGKKPFSKEGLDNWYRHFHKLEGYCRQYAHGQISVIEAIDEELAQWIAVQRSLKDRFPSELKNKLTALNFDFEEQEDSWEHNYRQLARFVNKSGHSYLPSDEPRYETLRDWLLRQIRDKKFLSENRFQKLDALCVEWHMSSSREHRWELMYKKLKEFYKTYGHCRVPFQWEPNPRLAAWVYRMKKKRHELADQTFKQYCFDWSLNRRKVVPWREMYACLAAFKQQYGHTRVPVKWPEDPKLGRWVSRMRQEKERLYPERILLLEAISFDWGYQCASEPTCSEGNK